MFPVLLAPMAPEDLDSVMTLERQCFKDPWSRRMYLLDLTQNSLATYLVLKPASTEPPILAYGGFWLLVDEAHIATLATHPDWRGYGLGQWLILALLDAAEARGATCATLEVRVGNWPARRLYEKLGFEIAGLRPHYYRDGEDGLIMTSPVFASAIMRQRLPAARAEATTRIEELWPRHAAQRAMEAPHD